MGIRTAIKQTNAAPVIDDGRCFVTGCPMPGSITASTSYHDGRKFFCRHHFGEPLEKWGEITRRLRNKPVCKYGDPLCPCQDGDQCHYEGKNPMKPPCEASSGEAATSTVLLGTERPGKE